MIRRPPGVFRRCRLIRFSRLLLLFLVFCPATFAAQRPVYYGRDFYTQNLNGTALKDNLHHILSDFHIKADNDFDQISASCMGGAKGCYRHTAIGYKQARVFLFGDFYLVTQNKMYGVKDVYCDRVVFSPEFPGAKPGPNQVPDANVMNAEHSWPQSLFTRAFPKEDQKSDVHHLFPTDSSLNSKRSSLEFGNVATDSEQLECANARLGMPKGGHELVFEPPSRHRGNVARAIFYFSTRYKLAIDAAQEAALKEWHRADPVDQEERSRNERIFSLQLNRNPFVDFPELVEKISDF